MKRKFLGIFLSMLLLLQIGIIPAYAVEIADDFSSYANAEALANSFSKTTSTTGEKNTVTQMSLETLSDSTYGNVLKITESSPVKSTWYNVGWNEVSDNNLSGQIQANFSVYIDGQVNAYREFAIIGDTTEISFLSFRSGNIMRLGTKITEANTAFTDAATYENDTWYNVEFRYDLSTKDYYVAVRNADDNSLVAKETLNVKTTVAEKYHTKLDGITKIVDFQIQSRIPADVTGETPSVYVDNLSIKNISVDSVFDESEDDASDKKIEDDFSGYADKDALLSAFSNAGTSSSGEENTVTQMSLETLSDSTYGNVLKITESSPEVQKWYYAKWNAVSGAELSGLIKASFSVNIDNETGFREFAILDGTKELSFISFRNGSIQRVDPDKTGEARVSFTNPATYEINTWYNVEFEYNLNTGEYYVAVRNAANNNSLIAEEKLTLIRSKRPAIEAVDGFAFQSRRDDGEASGPAVYIDNLSIENISEPETEDFYVTPVTYTHINPDNANKTITLTALKNAEITSWDVTSWVPVVAADGVTGINLKAYLALYKDGSLEDVKILPITTAGEHPVKFDEAIALAEGSNYMLRTYVWSGDTLIPMVADAGISN